MTQRALVNQSAPRHAAQKQAGSPSRNPREGELRVLLVTPRYFPYTGGVENHVYQVARRFASRGVVTTVLTTDPSRELPARESVEGVQIRRVPAWPKRRDYYFAPGIYREIATGAWDVVHLQSYHTLVAPLAMAASLRARIPYIVTFHGGGHSSRLRNKARGLQWQLLRPLLARAARLVATARFEIPFYGAQLGLPHEHFVFIPNGGDLPQFKTAPAQPRTPAAGTLIASVGRLERYKGHQRVLAALPRVIEHRPEARLWIGGEGPFAPELQRMAVELGIAERVEISAVPAAERQAMAERLSSATLVVLMSEYETHPMAVLEAAALGRSILVANTSGLSELAEQGFARAIPLESSPEQVAQAILHQLDHPHTPARVNLPTWDDCAADLQELYSGVARRTQCAY